NEQALLAHRPDPKDVHYITDSDDLFSLSLAPLAKDVEWYANPRRLSSLSVGAWWLRYDSPANGYVAKHYFYVHAGDRTQELWQRVARESDRLMQRVAGAREVLRVLSALAADRQNHAEQLLALALAETKLAAFVGGYDGIVTILLPRAAATYRRLFAADLRWSARGARRRLVLWLLDHVLVGRVRLTPGEGMTVRTALGGQRRVTWRGDAPFIDGVAIDPAGFVVS